MRTIGGVSPPLAVTMSAALEPLTLGEFLTWEPAQPGRYEFDGVQPVAMTGGSRPHARVCARLVAALVNRVHLPCEAYGADLKVQTTGRIRYPDAFSCPPMAPNLGRRARAHIDQDVWVLFGDQHAAARSSTPRHVRSRSRRPDCAADAASRRPRHPPRAFPSINRRMHQIRHPIQPRRMPRIRRNEIGQIRERHPAGRIGPGIRRPNSPMPEHRRRPDRA